MIKRITVRFDLDSERDAAAWSYIHQQKRSSNQTILSAIHTAMKQEDFEETVFRAVSKAMSGMAFSQAPQESQSEPSDDSAVMDFLSSF